MDPGELNRPDLAVLGFGRFGRFAAGHLGTVGETVVFDPRDPGEAAREIGARAVPLEQAARARHLLLCMPIGELRELLRALRPHLLPRTVLIDTCSVKAEPARILVEETPDSIDLLATHPLFGPDSGGAGLAGLRIVVCPLRRGRPRLARRFLERLGLEVILSTPEEHDRQIAETQALVQWIGRALERVGAGPRRVDTVGYQRLLEILTFVSRDSWQLFRDMQRRNPYAAAARRRFLDALREVEERLMDGWVVVFRAAGIAEAEVVKGYLESLDIPVDLDYESAGKVYGLTMDGLGEVRLRVPDDYEEAARLAIAERLGDGNEGGGGDDVA
ncbi:MAG: prephenate dehydrogenase/arogenate dehydrogenase family protein [Candidatus Eisenbacteria bacterium]|nr:prephenate dehydrogenase/arogenate dehydrogenase family protein [Candidatus Latescibacterota bacterium]MBD3301528.1 prephenate dehydrogenase/arogenate dehydrogenase family protein [Candidatus Eisenbacteria bacterium]